MSTLRLLSFNIHGGYSLKGERDLHKIHQLLENLEIDIAVFQEVETRPSHGGSPADIDILAGLERPYHLPGPALKEGKGWYGNLIVSRYPITRAQVHNLETTKILEPRNAVDATIDSPIGKLRVIGTHLSLTAMVRWTEVNNLIRLVDEVEEEEKYPLFFMGDFNEWSWSSKLIDHMDDILYPLSCGKTFPSFFPLFRLDRVWCDEDVVKAKAQVLTGYEARSLSDHLPVLVEIDNLGRKAVSPVTHEPIQSED